MTLTKELENNGDIVIGAFDDTYENLALKTQLALEYASDECVGVTYFIFQGRFHCFHTDLII